MNSSRQIIHPTAHIDKATIARLVQKGFHEICHITGASFYQLPYRCEADDLEFDRGSTEFASQGVYINVIHYEIPAVPMLACVDKQQLLPHSIPTWLAAPGGLTTPAQREQLSFRAMAGPRWAGVLGFTDQPQGETRADRHTEGMRRFYNDDYRVFVHETFVAIDNKNYIRELELHQKGNVRQPLITPNHTPPQEVVYMASYSVYREDSREHLIEQANFEFTAKLRRNHAHHPQARGSQANIPDILPS